MPKFHLDRIRGPGDPISNKEMLDDLCRVAQSEQTSTLSQSLYSQHGQFDCTTVARRFGSWTRAVSMIGLKPGDNQRPQRVSDEQLLEDLKHIAKLNNSDTVSQKLYGKKGHYAYNTVIKRFGSWNKALEMAGLTVANRCSIPDIELFENILEGHD